MDGNDDTRVTGGRPANSTARDDRTKLIAGRISASIAVVCALFGVAFFSGRTGIAAGVLGFVLGILGYLLGSRRLGTAAILLSIAALFIGLAASQGMIPGIEASGSGQPAGFRGD